MKWSTASDNCASVANSAYAREHKSVVRAAYAVIDSAPDCFSERSWARKAPSNSKRQKIVVRPSRNFS